ncbi:MAG: VWA domain-containing protein, partial [Chloroflexi bacterium]|nr:VWA domain-containing protein [Chloroflexota bacterium]
VFLWPELLWLLLLIPFLLLAYIWSQRRRHKYAVRFASLSLVKEALGKGPGVRRHIPPTIFLLALSAMIIGLARPQAVVVLPKQEGTVILTIDVSGSMQADDLKPTRMEAAKDAARNFVQKQPNGVRVAVVSFTDNAFIVQAPTTDRDAVIAAINRLQPQRGTAIGRGILTSLDAIFETNNADVPPNQRGTPLPTPTRLPKGEYAPAIVVLLTDGESNVGPEPAEAAKDAAARGVRVYTIGIGTAEGTILRIQGRSVRTRLDEAGLKRVADLTDGEYYNATNEQDLHRIYDSLGKTTVLRTEKTEVTYLFTGVAVGLALLAGMLSLWWFNRLP